MLAISEPKKTMIALNDYIVLARTIIMQIIPPKTVPSAILRTVESIIFHRRKCQASPNNKYFPGHSIKMY
jgi:hypothetical protein